MEKQFDKKFINIVSLLLRSLLLIAFVDIYNPENMYGKDSHYYFPGSEWYGTINNVKDSITFPMEKYI